MASIAITGHAMSGKSYLAVVLAGFPIVPAPALKETCSTSYIKADMNGTPLHIWDTPRYQTTDWAAHEIVSDADIILVCHDGIRSNDPYDIIENLDVDKCVIVHTRDPTAGFNLSLRHRYFCTLTTKGQLVPIVPAYESVHELLAFIYRRVRALQEGSANCV